MTGMSAPGDGIGKARLYVLELAFLVFLAAIAIFSRLYGIGQAPPGIHPEEATVGVMAQDVLRGQLPVFSPRQGGEGVLITYLAALSILAGGANILTMRLFASFIGIASILLAYFSARELFLYDGGELDARLVAGLAVLHLVISPWHLDLSRIVFAMVLTLLVESLLLYQLWHAVRSGRRGHFALTGFLLGLVMYGYIAGYVMPLLLFCYFML
jgi:4-amino-4-deoxy-L-arabinose transferase-like glycosyltransferase